MPPPPHGWTPQPPPPQQSWTPPPPPVQHWPSYQQGWSPPPGYGAAPYYQRVDEYASSPLATISGVLLLVIGGIITLLGVGVFFVGIVAGPFIESLGPAIAEGGDAVAPVIVFFGVVIGVIGILEIAAGIGVFVHKAWARWFGIALATIGLILGFFMLVGTMSDRNPEGGSLVISVLWVAANGFVVAALAVANEHFERGYARR